MFPFTFEIFTDIQAISLILQSVGEQVSFAHSLADYLLKYCIVCSPSELLIFYLNKFTAFSCFSIDSKKVSKKSCM